MGNNLELYRQRQALIMVEHGCDLVIPLSNILRLSKANPCQSHRCANHLARAAQMIIKKYGTVSILHNYGHISVYGSVDCHRDECGVCDPIFFLGWREPERDSCPGSGDETSSVAAIIHPQHARCSEDDLDDWYCARFGGISEAHRGFRNHVDEVVDEECLDGWDAYSG